jgi:hypothetical protein
VDVAERLTKLNFSSLLLEEKIRVKPLIEERITYFTTQVNIFTRFAPPKRTREAYQLMAYQRWLSYYVQRLAELNAHIAEQSIARKVQLTIIFSVETGGGREPLVAELRADTSINYQNFQARESDITRRIVNAGVKVFWFAFDRSKDFHKDDPNRDTLDYFWEGNELAEVDMDWLFKEIIKVGGLKLAKDEYFVYQAVIKVGVQVTHEVETRSAYPVVTMRMYKAKPDEYARGEKRDIGVKVVHLNDPNSYFDLLAYFGMGWLT